MKFNRKKCKESLLMAVVCGAVAFVGNLLFGDTVSQATKGAFFNGLWLGFFWYLLSDKCLEWENRAHSSKLFFINKTKDKTK